MKTFNTQLRAVQQASEDYEWYPTTDAIIAELCKDMKRQLANSSRRMSPRFVDIGAGNGKVLNAVKRLEILGNRYAIELSQTLLDLLEPEVFVLGVDFWKTSLTDKAMEVIFSNPPYSRFEEWSTKILREADSGTLIYLVIPERWENSPALKEEFKRRKATNKIVGSFDFENAEDRKARAKVHLLRIWLADAERQDESPFSRFFDETFKYPEQPKPAKPFQERLEETKVVHRANFIEALCILYDARMAELQRNYQAICTLSYEILKEFQISRASLLETLKLKLDTAKKEYWQRLFDGMSEIYTRLTNKSRKSIVGLMQDQTGIDFNRENAYAIIFWVIKNANSYFDDQLIQTYEQMVEYANVENYASNKRIFKTDRFRYNSVRDTETTHIRLKVGHRMVLNHCGGLKKAGYTWERDGLCAKASEFLGDLLTVASNLGFNVVDRAPQENEWRDSKARELRIRNPLTGKFEVLLRVRAFYNWNMHIQFHPDFIHALNIQHGKLKGWLRNDSEAARELEIPIELAEKHFTGGFRLTSSSLPFLALPAA